MIKRSTNNFIPKPGLGIKLFPCICLTNDLNLVLFLQQFVIILDPQAAIKLVCMRDLEQAGRVLLKHIYHASSLQPNYELRSGNWPSVAPIARSPV